MVIKMNKEQEQRLKCICGVCDHGYDSKTCLYNKILESDEPGEEQLKQTKKLIADIVKLNMPKATSAKITKKEESCKKKKTK